MSTFARRFKHARIGHCKSSIKLGVESAKTSRIHLSKVRKVRINSFPRWRVVEFASKIDSLVSSVVCQSGSYRISNEYVNAIQVFRWHTPAPRWSKLIRKVFKRDLHSLGTRDCRMKYEILTCRRDGVTWRRCSFFSFFNFLYLLKKLFWKKFTYYN